MYSIGINETQADGDDGYDDGSGAPKQSLLRAPKKPWAGSVSSFQVKSFKLSRYITLRSLEMSYFQMS